MRVPNRDYKRHTTGTESYAWLSLTNAIASEARGSIAEAMRPRLKQPLVVSE